jgi:hypothetical protein
MAIYYVSLSGSNGNPGSFSLPWRTLNYAGANVTAGDTVYVRAGTYVESLGIGAVASGTSWANTVKFAAYAGETVWMKPGASSTYILSFGGSQQYIDFDGINLDASSITATHTILKVTHHDTDLAHHIRFQNAEVVGTHSATLTDILSELGIHLAIGTPNVGGNELINLTIRQIGRTRYDQAIYIEGKDNLVEECHIYDFAAGGIELYSASVGPTNPRNNIIRKNRIHDPTEKASLSSPYDYGTRGITIDGNANQIYNNIVHDFTADDFSESPAIWIGGGDDNEVYNNTIYNMPSDHYGIVLGYNFNPTVDRTIVKNNLVWSTTNAFWQRNDTATTASNNLWNTDDPLFVDASNDDFRLSAGSPAIDTGTTVAAVTADYFGGARPFNSIYDIGAHEYGSTPTDEPDEEDELPPEESAAADVSVKVGSFTKQAGTGAQSVTGLGFTPKALMIWTNNGTSLGRSDRFRFISGITDGTFSVGFHAVSDDNAAATTARRNYEEGVIWRSVSAANVLEDRATFTSFDADGFTINWATNSGSQAIVFYWAIGGSAVSADVGVFDSPGSASVQSVTGIGFQPTTLLLFEMWDTATSSTDAYLNVPRMGWADSLRTGGTCTVASESAADPSNTVRLLSSTYPTRGIFSGSGGNPFGQIARIASIASYNADGFTIDYTLDDVPVATGTYYLALKGVTTTHGLITQPTTTGLQSVSVSGTPILALFQSVGSADTESVVSESQYSFGASDGTDQASTWVGDLDNQATTVTARSNRDDTVVQCITPAATGSSSTINALAAVSAFGSNAFQLNWSTVDSTQRKVIYLAFVAASEVPEEEFPSGGGGTGGGGGGSGSGGGGGGGFGSGTVSPDGSTIGLTWLEWTDLGGTTRAMAQLPLPDDADYYEGFKEGRVDKWHPIRRALSDRRGSFEGVQYGATVNDADRAIRTILSTEATKHFRGNVLVERMISDAGRRAKLVPRTVGRGIIREYAAKPGLQFDFACQDPLSVKFSATGHNADQVPKRTLTGISGGGGGSSMFPNLPLDAVLKGVPIIYGELADSVETGDTAANGHVPVIYTGFRDIGGTNYHEFLVAGHACKSIDAWYIDTVLQDASTAGGGGVFKIPGYAGWTALFGSTVYRDIGGQRFTFIYHTDDAEGDALADGSSVLTLAMKGIEDVGDGSGLLITDVFAQYYHWLVNWAYGDYQSGAWLAAPTFADEATIEMIDGTTFDTCSTSAEARISGGYVGAGIIGANGERSSVRDLIAKWNRSGDVDCGFNRKCQFVVSMTPDTPSAIASDTVVTQSHDIRAGSFEIRDDVDELYTELPLLWQKDYVDATAIGWQGQLSLINEDLVNLIDEDKVAPNLELHFIRRGGVAQNIAQHYHDRHLNTPRLVRWREPLRGTSNDLGDIVTVTHDEGIGPTGWTENPVRIVRHIVHPDDLSVEIEAQDLSLYKAFLTLAGAEMAGLIATASPASNGAAVMLLAADPQQGNGHAHGHANAHNPHFLG